MEGYQVSAQCMALVRDNCFVPTKDAPELGYVRESTDKQYVPDVFYKVSSQDTKKQNRLSFFSSLFAFIIFFLIQLHHVRGICLWNEIVFFMVLFFLARFVIEMGRGLRKGWGMVWEGRKKVFHRRRVFAGGKKNFHIKRNFVSCNQTSISQNISIFLLHGVSLSSSVCVCVCVWKIWDSRMNERAEKRLGASRWNATGAPPRKQYIQ